MAQTHVHHSQFMPARAGMPPKNTICPDTNVNLSSSLTNLSWLANMSSPTQTTAPQTPTSSPTYRTNSAVKPPFSIPTLMVKALLSSESGRRTANEICEWVARNFPYYRNGSQTWRSTIRHQLSLNKFFCQAPVASMEGTAYWQLTDEAHEQFAHSGAATNMTRSKRRRGSKDSSSWASEVSSPSVLLSPQSIGLLTPISTASTPSLSCTPSLDAFSMAQFGEFNIQNFLDSDVLNAALECTNSSAFLETFARSPEEDIAAALGAGGPLLKYSLECVSVGKDFDADQFMTEFCFATPEDWLL
eukprot:comp19233_c0_seq1/m.22002 comp19233_c0_seq1/g.22002  ORF comp19233_c0_seq1/g.22002 comp19233_c0_seq1/m.22002 type:complete len:302 (-) comp19233_c0_seq1:407-1312(-)